MKKIKLILASASPRRHELLNAAGLFHTVVISNADESAAAHTADEAACDMPRAVRYAAEASRIKCRATTDILKSEDSVRSFVISADTVVSPDLERVLGKPADRDDARNILMSLSGKMHYVVGGITVAELGGESVTRTVSTEVYFDDIESAELEAYLSTDEPYDKAGAYGIQGRAAMFVREIRGDYANVVGISVFALKNILTECFGISPEELLG